MSYEGAVAYVLRLGSIPGRNGASTLSVLLATLGDPHLRFKTVVVAGSDGKSSTAAFIASALSSARIRTGLLRYPHMVDFCERISVDGVSVSGLDFERLVGEAGPIAESLSKRPDCGPISTDAFLLALGLRHLSASGVDFAVVEVESSIFHEASELLKPDVVVIPAYLAGVGSLVKEGRIVITAEPVGPGLSSLQQVCLEAKAQLVHVATDVPLEGFDSAGSSFGHAGERYSIQMVGRHQVANALTALAALQALRDHGAIVPDEAIKDGLHSVRLPGRLELFGEPPRVVIDAADTLRAFQALKAALTALFDYEDLYIVIGMLNSDEIPVVMKEIAPLAEAVIVCKPQVDGAANAEHLAIEAQLFNENVVVQEDVAAAVALAKKMAQPADLIVVCGSVSAVAEARRYLTSG